MPTNMRCTDRMCESAEMKSASKPSAPVITAAEMPVERSAIAAKIIPPTNAVLLSTSIVDSANRLAGLPLSMSG